MTPTQREAALRLADALDSKRCYDGIYPQAAALLRELLAEPQVGDDVAWLWTHCKALGMKCKSLSGSRRDDIALYVVDLHDLRAEPHREVAGVEVLPCAPTYTEQQIADACMADAARFRWLDEVALSVDMVADPDNLVQVWHETLSGHATTGRTLREAVDEAMKRHPANP